MDKLIISIQILVTTIISKFMVSDFIIEITNILIIMVITTVFSVLLEPVKKWIKKKLNIKC